MLPSHLGTLGLPLVTPQARRAELRQLLGDLPGVISPPTATKLDEAVRDDYVLETLVLDLLNLARLDEHRPLMLKPVDMAQLIRDALDDLRIQQPGRDITISAPPVAIVNGDETRLRQIMANLVGNIRSYTPEDSPVAATVTIAADQKWHDKALDVVLIRESQSNPAPSL